jgi:hypothetical protein
MERTVPSTVSEEIELYLRTIYSLLRSTTEVQIRTLEEVHAGMNSSLHTDARRTVPDPSAFIYSLQRLPECMPQVNAIILGQSAATFSQYGYNLQTWEPVSSRARRRRCFFDGQDTLACYIGSRSDIDDVVPTLTSYQIEWNKLNFLLNHSDILPLNEGMINDPNRFASLAAALQLSGEDLERLKLLSGADFIPLLNRIASRRCSMRVRLLSGSLSEYWRATRTWWDAVEAACNCLLDRPVYFISSNTHSVINLLSGFALQHKGELVTFLERSENASLLAEWQDIEARHVPSSQENFLYYILKKYQQSPDGKYLVAAQLAYEEAIGIVHVPSDKSLDIEAQIFDLASLNPETIDPRLAPGLWPDGHEDWSFLTHSNALILNIDYPLGYAAYHVLAKVAEHISPLLGVYILGKAASLNGVRGDVMIPNVVHDEHSQNTYLFQNALTASDVSPYLVYGTVLDNQKAVTVLGTFLQNSRVMDVIYREGYTDIEMEAGPYLSAIYEMVRPRRHPVNEIVNLYGASFDLGILHYISDTPLTKGKNLGAGTLSYFGMDSTYATSLAVLRRIFQKESQRVKAAEYSR